MRKLIEVGYESPISRANADHWKWEKKKAAKRKKHILETGKPEPVWPPIRGKNRKPQLTSEEKCVVTSNIYNSL